jgi:hypothetical protein
MREGLEVAFTLDRKRTDEEGSCGDRGGSGWMKHWGFLASDVISS